ncbi:MAG: hypothetical protein WDN49_25425 [Acetobacteraceae bacterium]
MTILEDQSIGGFLPQDTLKFRCGDAGRARGADGPRRRRARDEAAG